MSTPIAAPVSTDWTAEDLVDRFGPIPLWRIRQVPPPGTATEQDVIDIHDREGRLYELVDGVLVEKTVGVQESYLAVWIATVLRLYAEEHDVGIVLGPDGMSRLAPGLVRIPDVSFVSWDRLGSHSVPRAPMLTTGPDLAVEVLSPSNTRKEMTRKLAEYFDADVKLVWFVDPRQRTVQVYVAADEFTVLDGSQTLDGGSVLPGFQLKLQELFAKLDQQPK